MSEVVKPQLETEELSAKLPVYAWYALGLLTFVYVLNFLDRSLIYILFAPIKKEMAFSLKGDH